jgi:hypothetical protein
LDPAATFIGCTCSFVAKALAFDVSAQNPYAYFLQSVWAKYATNRHYEFAVG